MSKETKEFDVKYATLHQAIAINKFFNTTSTLFDTKMLKGVTMTYDGVNLYFYNKDGEVALIPAAGVSSIVLK